MQPFILISILVFALLILWLLIVVAIARKSNAGLDLVDREKHPKGYWMGWGIAIGIAIGAALGPIFDNFGVGIGIGVAIGAGIGASLEQKNKDKIRPATEEEKKMQRWGVALGGLVAVLALGVILLIVLFLQTR